MRGVFASRLFSRHTGSIGFYYDFETPWRQFFECLLQDRYHRIAPRLWFEIYPNDGNTEGYWDIDMYIPLENAWPDLRIRTQRVLVEAKKQYNRGFEYAVGERVCALISP